MPISRSQRVVLAALVSFGLLVAAAEKATASVIYDFSGQCVQECGPVGVITGAVTTVTGFLALDIPSTLGAWATGDVLDYQFNIGGLILGPSLFGTQTLADVSVPGSTGPATATAAAPFTSTTTLFTDAGTNGNGPIALRLFHVGTVFVQGGNNPTDLVTCGNFLSPNFPCVTAAVGAWQLRDGNDNGGGMAIPEPSTLAIFAFGLAGLGFMMRRRRGI